MQLMCHGGCKECLVRRSIPSRTSYYDISTSCQSIPRASLAIIPGIKLLHLSRVFSSKNSAGLLGTKSISASHFTIIDGTALCQWSIYPDISEYVKTNIVEQLPWNLRLFATLLKEIPSIRSVIVIIVRRLRAVKRCRWGTDMIWKSTWRCSSLTASPFRDLVIAIAFRRPSTIRRPRWSIEIPLDHSHSTHSYTWGVLNPSWRYGKRREKVGVS